MIITCMQCGVSFNLNEDLLKPTGSKVRCSKCKDIFTAYPPVTEPEPEPEPELEPERSSEEPDTIVEEPPVQDKEDDFSELEQLLEEDDNQPEEPEPSETTVEEVEIDAKEEEFDLTELEGVLDSEGTSDDDEEPPNVTLELAPDETLTVDIEGDGFDLSDDEEPEEEAVEDLDLDFDLGPGEDEVSVEEASEGEEVELDIEPEESPEDSLEEELDLDIEPADSQDDDLDLDLDLDLEADEELSEDLGLDIEEDAEEDGLDLEPSEDGEDLELDLGDLVEPDLGSEEGGGEDLELDEIDLEITEDSVEDLEQFGEDISEEETIEAGDLELTLDDDEEPDGLDTSGTDELAGGGEEIDLNELEQTLEMELLSEDTGDDQDPVNEDLALADDEVLEEETDFEDESDVDDSDIEKLLEMDEEELPLEEDQEMDSDELELEFDVSEGDQKTEKIEKAADVEAKDDGLEKELEKELREEKVTEKPASFKKKKKMSLPILILMILVILTGAAVGGLFFMKSQGIEVPHMDKLKTIPYIGEFLTPKETGAVEAVQSSITSDFINNQSAGKLFIITGKVNNTTKYVHHSVQITAKLYTKGKKLAKSKVAYCGKIMSKDELFASSLDIITKRLSTRTTETGQLINLKPGQSLPFMVVIPNLPDNLEEYEIRVSSSMPVKTK